jgi:hypothetical protein
MMVIFVYTESTLLAMPGSERLNNLANLTIVDLINFITVLTL